MGLGFWAAHCHQSAPSSLMRSCLAERCPACAEAGGAYSTVSANKAPIAVISTTAMSGEIFLFNTISFSPPFVLPPPHDWLTHHGASLREQAYLVDLSQA